MTGFVNPKKSNPWVMPDFIPEWDMQIVAKAYVQWVNEGRPIIQEDFIERIMNADLEAMAHMHWMDDIIEFEKHNPVKDIKDIYSDLYGDKR